MKLCTYTLIVLFAAACSSQNATKIHFESNAVLDIEVNSEQIKPFCSIPGDPEKKNYFIVLYVFYDGRIASIAYRRPITGKACAKEIQTLNTFISQSKRIRIIGVEKVEGDPDSELPVLMDNPKLNYVNSYWKISRIMSGKGCHEYLRRCNEPFTAERNMYTDH